MEREGECEVLEGEGVGQEQGERGLKREEGAQHGGREAHSGGGSTLQSLQAPC